jgi:hypothetical protein
MPQHINLTVKVNNSAIRRETLDGREHIVVPGFTLPANVVMNGVLYPQEEIDKHYMRLEGTLAPLEHPVQDKKHVSATSAYAINNFHVGAHNRNVRKVGNRIYVEKWVDVEFANNSEKGRRLVSRLEAAERGDDSAPIHTSVALFIDQMAANDDQKKTGARHVARIVEMDHDAILLDSVGAATPADGVGLMVNADLAMNASLLSDSDMSGSYRNKESALQEAARARFPNEEYTPWVADFSDTHVILVREGKNEQFEYSVENGRITIGETGTPVQRKESWIAVLAAHMKGFFQPVAATPSNKEGDMPITPEESAAVAKQTADLLAVNLAAALKPVTEAITALQEGQKAVTETLTANARADVAAKRAKVAAVHGDIIANGLAEGEALDAMVKSLGTSASLAANSGLPDAPGGLSVDVNNLPKE